MRIEDPLADFLGAVGLLTRLPVARHVAPSPRGVWAYPVVGALIGAIGGAIYLLFLRLGVGEIPAAIWSVAGQLLLTGALHEDGLADTADGFGGGRDVAGKLAIMRDSRIGAFGAIALILALGLRVSVISSFAGWPAVAVLVAAGASGRAGMVVLLARLSAARSDGVAAGLQRPPGLAVALAVAVAVAIDLWFGARLVLAAGLACAAIGSIAQRQIGGYSGDVLGACEQVVEAAVLSVA